AGLIRAGRKHGIRKQDKEISMHGIFHTDDSVTAIARSFSTIILTLLLGCPANSPYRDLNVLSDPSNFGGYIGREPQQKSFYGRTPNDHYDLAFFEFDRRAISGIGSNLATPTSRSRNFRAIQANRRCYLPTFTAGKIMLAT